MYQIVPEPNTVIIKKKIYIFWLQIMY
jgi:hypothetical protein